MTQSNLTRYATDGGQVVQEDSTDADSFDVTEYVGCEVTTAEFSEMDIIISIPLDELPDDDLPETEQEHRKKLAEKAMRGAQRQIGHHHTTRKKLQNWARDEGTDADQDAAYSLSPKEVHMCTITGDDEQEVQQKVETVLKWVRENYPEQAETAREKLADRYADKLESAKENFVREEKTRLFMDERPETFNGWTRLDEDKMHEKVELAYGGETKGKESIAVIYHKNDGSGQMDGGIYLTNEEQSSIGVYEALDADPDEQSKNHIIRPPALTLDGEHSEETEIMHELRRQLTMFDAEEFVPFDA